jgi:hypothetical protein
MAALPFSGIVKAHDTVRGVRRITFNAAGIAHNHYPIASLRVDQFVRIERKDFSGQPCFELRDSAGLLIGYVPKKLVPLLLNGSTIGARVAGVRRHAVPWKQVRLEVSIKAKNTAAR